MERPYTNKKHLRTENLTRRKSHDTVYGFCAAATVREPNIRRANAFSENRILKFEINFWLYYKRVTPNCKALDPCATE